MDALKSAGRAIIRSPSIAKQSWGSSKHKKLPENWTDTRETLQEGMIFNLKYLGMTLVEEPKGEDMSSAAVRRIVAMAKASGKKFQKVVLTVSPRGIILHDGASNELIENVSIYRISYCTADKVHDKVFAYIAQSQMNETLECHAFLCTKKKLAQAVTLTVAQAFKIAFEFWQAAKEEKEKRVATGSSVSGAADKPPMVKNHFKTEVATADLLDLTEGAKPAKHRSELSNADKQYSIDDNLVWEMNDDLDEAFASCSLDSFDPAEALKHGEGPYEPSTHQPPTALINPHLITGQVAMTSEPTRCVFRENLTIPVGDSVPTAAELRYKLLAQSRTNPQLLDIGVSPQDVQTDECLSPSDWEKSDNGVTEKDDLFGL